MDVGRRRAAEVEAEVEKVRGTVVRRVERRGRERVRSSRSGHHGNHNGRKH